jgi:carbon-monoxide dehydrogenase medium subunit
MYPPPFGYIRVSTPEEAMKELEENEDARILAGGHSLIPMLKLRLIRPSYLIDINRITSLSYVNIERNSIKIGALTRHHQLEVNSELGKIYPIFPEAASQIADPQVRNMGTIGGSLAHSDPAADWPAVLVALKAKVKIASRSGERTVSIDDFQKGMFTTDLKRGEMVKEIEIPLVQGSKSSYIKLERRAGDFAIVGVAVFLKLDSSSVVEDAGIGLTAVGPKAIRPKEAEETLKGKKLTQEVIEEAAEKAMKASNPTSDIRGSAEYKRAMVKVLTKRAIKRALER